MFGYINIYKDELKVKEYNVFRGYYCGLCKTLGKQFNQLVRLGLNYDLTFLAILLDSIYDTETVFANEGCIKNIAKKKTVTDNKAVSFAADMSIVLTYYKLADDIKDDKSIKAMLAIVPYWFAVRRLKGRYGDIIDKIKANLEKLSELEKRKCSVTDEAAHPFAQIMADIFELANPALKALGYNLGRFVYIADACDDMDDDLKNGAYNPLNLAYGYNGVADEKIKRNIENTIFLTLGYVGAEYEKLPKFKNKEILDNIIYMGIRARAEMLLAMLGKPQLKGSTDNE